MSATKEVIPLEFVGDEDEDEGPPQSVSIESELERFRQQWQHELSAQKRWKAPVAKQEVLEADLIRPSLEEEAKFLFLQGVNSEQSGKLDIAIQYYRRALQLVPDIESRIEEFQQGQSSRRDRTESEGSNLSTYSDVCEEEEDDDLEDLLGHFTRLRLADRTRCQPERENRGTHISALPVEVLMYIIKWVVSTDLDVISLENMAMVCREWFLCGRDEEIWRLICRKVWGRHLGSSSLYGSYRNMYIDRPHMRNNGVYIGCCHYYRQGEKSLDNLYKPYHYVEYFRYMRFFPDGHVMMLTTPEEPQSTVSKLRHKSANIQGLMYGVYRMVSDTVTCIMKRKKFDHEPNTYAKFKRRRNANNNIVDSTEQTFHAEFTVCHSAKRPRAQLIWQGYSIHTLHNGTGEETVTDFELTNESHAPLVFSRVKSYTRDTEEPLS